jgi:hypothetical protein
VDGEVVPDIHHHGEIDIIERVETAPEPGTTHPAGELNDPGHDVRYCSVARSGSQCPPA